MKIHSVKDVYNMFKDKLPYDMWNLEYRFKDGKRSKSSGYTRLYRAYKKLKAWETEYGNLEPQNCENESCDIIAPPGYYCFYRDGQKDDEGGYFLNFHTCEVIRTTGNPRKFGYSGPEVIWLEDDHIDPKTKTREMSKVVQLNEVNEILKERELCQKLCTPCHRDKTREEVSFSYKGKPRLPYSEAFRLIKEYIKPTSKYHFTPGKRYAHKYGKGALDEAIEKAKSNNDMALYDDLKRIPRNPYVTYAEQGIDTTNFWFEITGNENKDMRRNNGKT